MAPILVKNLAKICPKIHKGPHYLFIHGFMENLTRNLLGMIRKIRSKYAKTHTKSRQAPLKNFVIDQGLVQLVVQKRLRQESALSLSQISFKRNSLLISAQDISISPKKYAQDFSCSAFRQPLRI